MCAAAASDPVRPRHPPKTLPLLLMLGRGRVAGPPGGPAASGRPLSAIAAAAFCGPPPPAHPQHPHARRPPALPAGAAAAAGAAPARPRPAWPPLTARGGGGGACVVRAAGSAAGGKAARKLWRCTDCGEESLQWLGAAPRARASPHTPQPMAGAAGRRRPVFGG